MLRSYNFLHNARSSFGAIAAHPTPFRPTTENAPHIFADSPPVSDQYPARFSASAVRRLASLHHRTLHARVHTHVSSFSSFAFTPSPIDSSSFIINALSVKAFAFFSSPHGLALLRPPWCTD